MNKTASLLALTGLLVLGGASAAQAPDTPLTRQERMDQAYRDWQRGQASSPGQGSGAAAVSGQATPDDGSRPGWTTGSAKGDLKATGRAVKKAARDTGHAVAEGGRKVGRAAKRAGSKAKDAVTPAPKNQQP